MSFSLFVKLRFAPNIPPQSSLEDLSSCPRTNSLHCRKTIRSKVPQTQGRLCHKFIRHRELFRSNLGFCILPRDTSECWLLGTREVDIRSAHWALVYCHFLGLFSGPLLNALVPLCFGLILTLPVSRWPWSARPCPQGKQVEISVHLSITQITPHLAIFMIMRPMTRR